MANQKHIYSWLFIMIIGWLVGTGTLLFDQWQFMLITSSNIIHHILWIILYGCSGTFAYVCIAIIAGLTSNTPQKAIYKAFFGLTNALLIYYFISIFFHLRPIDATKQFLFQASFWFLAAFILSITIAPLSQKMMDPQFRYAQIASGVIFGFLGAPYWYNLLTSYSDGLYLIGNSLCAIIPIIMIFLKMRHGKRVSLILATIFTSLICILGLFLIYYISY